jgi:hypothetical protein
LYGTKFGSKAGANNWPYRGLYAFDNRQVNRVKQAFSACPGRWFADEATAIFYNNPLVD